MHKPTKDFKPYNLRLIMLKPRQSVQKKLFVAALLIILAFSLHKFAARSHRFSFASSQISPQISQISPPVNNDISKGDNFSIAVLSFENSPYSVPAKPPSDIKDICELSFNCVVSDHQHKSFPKSSINKFSAIIAWHWGHNRLLSFYKEIGGMSARPREQYWISTATESSVSGMNGILKEEMYYLFNWTATSGDDVTFQFDLFLVKKRKQKKPLAEVENDVKSHFAQKKNLVCWSVSNCGSTYTDRVTPAKDLARHLPDKLQLFGDAGSKCMKGMDEHVEYHGKTPGTYMTGARMNIENCLFYLSFENANCTDYVTEKFSNPLISYAIPIVNGFKKSYEKRLPGSFIFLNDFKSGKELSDYLQYLRGNWTAFMEYHKWRQYYTVHDLYEAQDELHCDICRRLKQEKDDGYKKNYIIPDVREFYAKMQTCIPKERKH
ncbi:4-galactosyl-N-acetylglucosaminide 3-alpha-L-fucosyltransferase 9-like isoform X2 [Convolutriloba macropyga]|uniref:4-galactosyl-N-acetylglucosaminide 3-alpha-L-fucosyltransferase 9-like isoform X2 n=1 Tax=Convolutriloba macropyga TaxID=536237 RepID=UPI003F51D44B